MASKDNVIDMTKRRQKQMGDGATTHLPNNPVIDMTARRNEIIARERRRVRRTILTEFIGACVVVPDQGLKKVCIYDISKNGMAFDLENTEGMFKNGEEVAMRVYLNQDTYFPFVVKVTNAREIIEEGVFRHGSNFVKGTVNDVALHHFIRFIETVSANLQKDRGDIVVSNKRK